MSCFHGIILETDRLFLREMNMDDFAALYKVLADTNIMQHYPYVFDEERVRSWIKRNMNRYSENGFGLWAVCLKDTGEMIGDCGLTLQNIEGEMLPEIGYHIRADKQHKGYAREAAAAVRDWAFANTDYPALYSYCKYTNVGSYKTAESIGMHFEKEYPDPENEFTHVSVIFREEYEKVGDSLLQKKQRELSEMTLEELWVLFPIFLVAHDDRWKDCYNEIEKTLTGLLSNQQVVRISHIGSTAIQEIWAKDIVDVMVEITQSADMKDMAQILERGGFTIMSSEAKRISLNKGYTKNGFADKVYHIHLRYAGDNDELYFRDYLNDHPDVAKEYETLKLRLWKQYEHNRDAYTDSKTDFISKWTAEARKEYGDRY